MISLSDHYHIGHDSPLFNVQLCVAVQHGWVLLDAALALIEDGQWVIDLGSRTLLPMCFVTRYGRIGELSKLLAYRRKMWEGFVCARECSEVECRAIVCKGTTRLFCCCNVTFSWHRGLDFQAVVELNPLNRLARRQSRRKEVSSTT